MENIENQTDIKNVLQKRNIYTKQDAGAVFLLAVIVPQIIGTIFVIFLMSYCMFTKQDYTEVAQQTLPTVFLTAISQLCFVGIFFGYNAAMHVNTKKACRLDFKIGVTNYILPVCIGIFALFGYNNLITSFDWLLNLLGHTSSSMPLPLDNGWWLVLNLFLLAVLPAIFEELLFRGIILNGLRQYGKWTAILGSAGLFTLLHGNIDQLIYPFLLGLIFGIIADRTASTIPTILAHFVNNSIVIVINYLSTINHSSQVVSVDWVFVLLSLLIAVLATGAIFAVMYFINRESKKEQSLDTTINQNDLAYFEKASTKTNVMLWVSIGIGSLIWLLNLINF